MTEDQIEKIISIRTDRADVQFLAGEMTQEQYDERLKAIDEWGEVQYSRLARG